MEKDSGKKTLIELIKFNLVSFGVTLIQLILVNVLLVLMKEIKTPLPGVLSAVFTPQTVGVGNDNWGYVLPFFLSNAIANAVGYFVNRNTTFRSDSPPVYFFLFFVVLTGLILISTWIQGRLVYVIRESFPSLYSLAATIASFIAGMIQFCVIFPLEKFVLFRKEKTHA